MWYGCPFHEATAIQRGKPILKETQSNEELLNLGTPFTEIEEFWTLSQTLLRIHQRLYTHERPDAVLSHHLHFTQLLRYEKMRQDTKLPEGFYIIIRFDVGCKNMSKGDAQSACVDRLHKMNILLGMDYSNPIDIGFNQITKNWANFLKLHLKHPLKDELTLLRGDRHSWWNLKGENR